MGMYFGINLFIFALLAAAAAASLWIDRDADKNDTN
jgi:hypothetical protein